MSAAITRTKVMMFVIQASLNQRSLYFLSLLGGRRKAVQNECITMMCSPSCWQIDRARISKIEVEGVSHLIHTEHQSSLMEALWIFSTDIQTAPVCQDREL